MIFVFQFSMEVVRLIVNSCHSLESLKLAGIRDVDDELLMSLAANCSELKTINLKGCDQVGTYPGLLCSPLSSLQAFLFYS